MRVSISLLLIAMIVSTGCSTARTRSSDPVMRIAIDADSVPQNTYMRLQHALVESGKFIVVDRAMGFRAALKEQNRQHQDQPTRFGDKEKYSKWGELFGVGGIVVATFQCKLKRNFFWSYNDCIENLALVNATTGEIMAVSEDHVSAPLDAIQHNLISPDWDDAVEDMIKHYPKTFVNSHNPNQTIEYSGSLEEYRDSIASANKAH